MPSEPLKTPRKETEALKTEIDRLQRSFEQAEAEGKFGQAMELIKEQIKLEKLYYENTTKGEIADLEEQHLLEISRGGTALEQKNLQLEKAREQLLVINEELVDADKKKNEIMQIVAHDLKNPLAGILFITQLVRKNFDTMEKADILHRMDNIQSCIEQLNLIISHLMNLHLDRSDLESKRQTFENPNIIIAAVAEQFEATAEAKNIQVIQQTNWEGGEILTSRHLLLQIVSNFLSNALKYSERGKRVWLIADDLKDGRIAIRVRDEGPGLEPCTIEKIFVKYGKGPAIPTAGETSTGIGLSIVKKFADKMGCTLDVHSDGLGKGSTFSIYLKSAFV